MSRLFRRHPHPDELDNTIDDDLRLRTVRTAASTIAESINTEIRAERRRKKSKRSRFLGLRDKKTARSESDTAPETVLTSGRPRRNIYVNQPLPGHERNSRGEPAMRYVRNKVRTSKYTILTFIPKNLYEQFRRVANLYFLALVCIQVFPLFGAAAPQLSMIPLVFILTVTAIKDGIEDYRRARLDEEVNTSAATKLGRWRNVNQPSDPRSWWEKLLGLHKPGSVTKGVRKLREREAMDIVVLQRDNGSMPALAAPSLASSSQTGLSTIASMPSTIRKHTYPPDDYDSKTNLVDFGVRQRVDSGASSSYPRSTVSRTSLGVVDYNRAPSASAAEWERTLWKRRARA